MASQKIIITVGEDGSVVGDVVGGQGMNCMNKLDELMKDIANTVESDLKPDYFSQGQSQAANVHVNNYR